MLMKNLLLFIFVLAFSWPVTAQNSNDTIVGRLVDAKGKAVRKALVSVKDVKAETDRYGIFQLNNVDLQDILTVVLPKTEKEVQVSVNGIAYPNIVLGPEISVTEDKGEIMKLMLRSLRRSRSVSSTIVVTGEELVATGESNLFNALAGKVPGFTVNYVGLLLLVWILLLFICWMGHKSKDWIM